MALTLSLQDPKALSVPDDKTIWIEHLAHCESSGDPTKTTLDTNGYYSRGLLQFQMATWLSYKHLGTTKENIYDADLQRKVARYILEKGGEMNWATCVGKIGHYPI